MGKGKKKKIEIKKIDDISRRQVTFSKRRQGLFKKAQEFCRIQGDCRFGAVIFSSAGHIYTAGDMSLVNRFAGALQMDAAADGVVSSLVTFRTDRKEVEDVRQLRLWKDELKIFAEHVSEMMKSVQQQQQQQQQQ